MWCFGFSTWTTREVKRSSKIIEGEEVLLKRPESAESIWARIASERSAAPTLERLPSDTSTLSHLRDGLSSARSGWLEGVVPGSPCG